MMIYLDRINFLSIEFFRCFFVIRCMRLKCYNVDDIALNFGEK